MPVCVLPRLHLVSLTGSEQEMMLCDVVAGAATALIASELQCSELQQRGEVRLSKRAQPREG